MMTPAVAAGGGANIGGAGKFGDTTYTKVFVGGLAWETQKETMEKYFEQFGEILEAVVITDKATGRSKGYGFVTFREPEAAMKACVDAAPVIDGRRANCNLACLGVQRSKSSTPKHGGGRNNLRVMSSFQSGGFGGTTFPSTAAATFPHYAIQQGIPFNLYGYSSYSPDYPYHTNYYNVYGGATGQYPMYGNGPVSGGMMTGAYYPYLHMASSTAPPAHLSLTFNIPQTRFTPCVSTRRPSQNRFKCSAGQTGFFTRLGRLIKEKAKSDVEKIFSGFSKTRDNLAVIDELLLYWNLADTDKVLDELEEALLVSDFGPRITIKIVENLREDILAGKLKSGPEIKEALKNGVLDLLTKKGNKTELQLGYRKPAVVMIVGVNGGGKTTSLGKLAYRLNKEGAKILMAAGDTFRAAASDQLEIWAERTGCEIVVAEGEKAKASSVLSQAVKKGKEQGFDIVLCDTSGRLHTNYSLMEELIACKKAVGKVVNGAPNEILLVLDGTTGLNMLPQAREFNEVVGITGLILTKLDGSARGGCVVSVVDELGIPVKFVGVGEGVEDLQPFDAEAFVDAIFS